MPSGFEFLPQEMDLFASVAAIAATSEDPVGFPSGYAGETEGG